MNLEPFGSSWRLIGKKGEKMSARPLLHLTLFISLWLTACASRLDLPENLPLPIPTAMEKKSPALLPTTTAKSAEASSTPTEANLTPASARSDPLQKKITDLTIADLAKRLAVDLKLIGVVSVDSVTWPNAALGCPRPEKVYTQGIVPGFRIKLTAAGSEYVYHADQKGSILLCPEGSSDDLDGPTLPIYPNDTTGGQNPLSNARIDNRNML